MKQSIYTLRSLLFKIALLISGILILPCYAAFAQGDLLISPLRIVFEGSKRSQEINLANVGKDTATYVISITDYRMKEDGGFEKIDSPDAGQNFAGPFLRFFPRKVTLAPNEAQVVKIQMIRTNELQPGEYRSHLYFRSVPDETPIGEKDPKKDTSGISIKLTPIFGITIPVIIRSGDYDADASLSNLIFYMKDTTPMLHIAFNRTGNMSTYGDVKVEHISPSGKTIKVKTVKGVGVYTPNPIRNMNIDLDRDKNVDYHSGKLHVTYSMQMGGNKSKEVEAEVELK